MAARLPGALCWEELGMATRGTKPREGESLAEWITRVRPAQAPAVTGQPSFAAGRFVWQADGWAVLVEIDETGAPAVHWEAPSGHGCIGYSLTADGERTAAVDAADGDAEWVTGWPMPAAAQRAQGGARRPWIPGWPLSGDSTTQGQHGHQNGVRARLGRREGRRVAGKRDN
jgi:hypothetical protein